MVEVANFGAISKTNTVTKPVKSVGQDHFALRANWQTVHFRNQRDRIAHLEVDLALMGRCECMRFPRGCHECKGYT